MTETFKDREEAIRTAFMNDLGGHVVFCWLHMNRLSDLWFSWKSVEQGTPSEIGLLFWSRSLDNVWCAVDLLTRGYPVQAASLLRHVCEDYLVFKYLQVYPKDADKFYEGNRPPRFSKMIKKIDDSDLTIWWDKQYGFLSELAHPRSAAAASKRKGDNLLFGPHCDEVLSTKILANLCLLESLITEQLTVLVHSTGVEDVSQGLVEVLLEGMEKLRESAAALEIRLDTST